MGTFHSEALRVIERFTATSSQTMSYEATLEDPSIFTEVWRGEVPMLAADCQIYEYTCTRGLTD